MSNDNKSLMVVPRSVDEFADLADRFSKSTLLPKAMQGKAPDVLVTIMAGAEMGLSPMASLRAIHVIEGRPVLSADGMVALVLGSGKAKYFARVAESDTVVTYETCRVGTDVPRRCTWTIEMAKRAALDKKDNWRMTPRAMLAARAKSELARDVFPDVLMGCYTEDEISGNAPGIPAPGEIPAMPSTPDDIADAEIVFDSPDFDMGRIDAAATIDDLKMLVPELAKLRGGARSAARSRYDDRKKALEVAHP